MGSACNELDVFIVNAWRQKHHQLRRDQQLHYNIYVSGGNWRQRADERLGDPPPSYPGAFNGQRQG